MTPAELKLAREEAEAVLDAYRRTTYGDSEYYGYMVDSAVEQARMVLELLKELEKTHTESSRAALYWATKGMSNV